jgi:hypothetical protein
MGVIGELIDRVRAAFAPPVRAEELDQAIKSLNEARDHAREAARFLSKLDPKRAGEASRAAESLNRLSKRLWSI